MRLDVIDPDKRNPPRHREPLRELDAHEERSDEAGAQGSGDTVDRFHGDLRRVEGLLHDARQKRDVGAGCVLGNDAAVVGVDLLPPDDVRDELPVLHDGSARVVTRGLDP